MKISGLSCITKKIFLVFLGHPNVQESVSAPVNPAESFEVELGLPPLFVYAIIVVNPWHYI